MFLTACVNCTVPIPVCMPQLFRSASAAGRDFVAKHSCKSQSLILNISRAVIAADTHHSRSSIIIQHSSLPSPTWLSPMTNLKATGARRDCLPPPRSHMTHPVLLGS